MLHLLLFYPSTWYICDFFLFPIEIEGKGGWIIGGPKGMLAPPLKLLGGGAWPPLAPPLPTPMPCMNLTYILCFIDLIINLPKEDKPPCNLFIDCL